MLPKVCILKERNKQTKTKTKNKQTNKKMKGLLGSLFSSRKGKVKKPSQVTSLGLPFTSIMGLHLKGKLAQ